MHCECNCLKKKCHVENISRCFKFAWNIKEKKKRERNSKLVVQWHFLWWNVLQAIWDLIWHLKNQTKTLVYYRFYEAIHLWFLYFKSAHALCSWRHLSWQVYFIRKEVKALMFPNVKLNLLQKSLHFWGETKPSH